MNSIENGMADTLSNELWNCAIEYNLLNRIIGLICDTENTNTGFHAGTCVKFETKIEKELLRLCCRHHILEIVLKKVCFCLLRPNETPNFSFEGFDQLKSQWKYLNTNEFHALELDDDLEDWPILSVLKAQAIEQLQNDASHKHIRDDYAEMTDICLKLLGIETKNSSHWCFR